MESMRLAVPADLPAIRDVVTAAYARYLNRMDRPPAPMLADYAAEVESGLLWVAGKPVAGLIELTVTSPSGASPSGASPSGASPSGAGPSLHVANVAVHPSAQGTGLGRRLMEFAEEQARQRGLARLDLYTNEVMTENQAIYARLGYRETARRTEDGYRRVFMEKILRPRP
jgi:ribosomal protein S18 acetylase RimI-like enzyme